MPIWLKRYELEEQDTALDFTMNYVALWGKKSRSKQSYT